MTDKNNSHRFYSHGKLLLSSEYFVLEGAKALALPTKYGQGLEVSYKKSFDSCLHWQGITQDGDIWFDAKLDLWNFELKDGSANEELGILQSLLRSVRKLNNHFLREENTTVKVKTNLEFPLNWGLGSSSTLIYNIAQWAHVSPFELLAETFGGSGYDIACAQSEGPIIYEISECGPKWQTVDFQPPFKNYLYFVFLGNKQSSRDAIKYFEENTDDSNISKLKQKLSLITESMLKAQELEVFESLLNRHEEIISKNLKLEKVKDKLFCDYWGTVKSLGAWGGDFVLVTSDRDKKTTFDYFVQKGFHTILTFDEMILNSGKFQ